MIQLSTVGQHGHQAFPGTAQGGQQQLFINLIFFSTTSVFCLCSAWGDHAQHSPTPQQHQLEQWLPFQPLSGADGGFRPQTPHLVPFQESCPSERTLGARHDSAACSALGILHFAGNFSTQLTASWQFRVPKPRGLPAPAPVRGYHLQAAETQTSVIYCPSIRGCNLSSDMINEQCGLLSG